MAEDELELDTLGDRKSALFVILSDTDSTFNFVAALMYSQLFNLLCDKADDLYGGRPAGPCAVPAGRVCEHRSDPELRQADCHHPKPGNIGFYYFAVPKPVKDHLQGRGGYHRGQLRQHLVFGRQGEIHPERNLGAAGQGDHRQLQSIGEPGQPGFPRPQLSKIGKGADDTRRDWQ